MTINEYQNYVTIPLRCIGINKVIIIFLTSMSKYEMTTKSTKQTISEVTELLNLYHMSMPLITSACIVTSTDNYSIRHLYILINSRVILLFLTLCSRYVRHSSLNCNRLIIMEYGIQSNLNCKQRQQQQHLPCTITIY